MEAEKHILNLPQHILKEIILFLDTKSIIRFNSLSRTLFKLFDENLWKILAIRDHLYFLACDPTDENDIRNPRTMREVEKIKETEVDANKIVNNPFDEPLTAHERETLEKNIATVSNWRVFYIAHKLKPNLSGYFVGDYGGHGYEFIRIYHKGYKIYAKKLTGDVNVPAGKITWKGTLTRNFKLAKGYIHLANEGFLNSWWSNCNVEIRDNNTFVITWFPCEYYPGFLLACAFFNIRGGFEPQDSEEVLRKQYIIPLEEE